MSRELFREHVNRAMKALRGALEAEDPHAALGWLYEARRRIEAAQVEVALEAEMRDDAPEGQG